MVRSEESIEKQEEYKGIPLSELLAGVSQRPVNPSHLFGSEESFQNRYIGFRHGQSKANIQGIISSDFQIGVHGDHGLTPIGETQVVDSVTDLLSTIGSELINNVVFVTSPFSRAKQTAELAALCLEGAVSVEINEGLRERDFGDFDQRPLLYYNRVWPVDELDAENTRNGVESVSQVCERAKGVIAGLEEKFYGKTIVLTSHADTLQILNCMFSQEDPRYFAQHRMKNCEVRPMYVPDLNAKRIPLEYK